jgi:uncharacterized membrane protein
MVNTRMEFLADLHPVVVHFPIALLTLYVLAEVVNSFWNNDKVRFLASILLIVGVISCVGAVLTGNQAEHAVENLLKKEIMQTANEIVEEHENNATILLWLFTGIMVVRYIFILKKNFFGIRKILITSLALIGLYFIFVTGNYGGQLVYKYGIGTEILNEIIK